MSQAISNLSTNTTYTLTYHYRVSSTTGSTCYVFVTFGQQAYNAVDAGSGPSSYLSRSESHQPTNSTETLTFSIDAVGNDPPECDIGFDDIYLRDSQASNTVTTVTAD